MPLDGMTPNEEAQLTQFLEQAEAEPSTATAGSEHDFFESNLESPDEVIEGLVRGGQWVVVAGLPNVGKSPMLADTTVRIIRGISWYGRSVSPRPVITFDLESNGNTYRLNILKVAERFQVDTPTVPDELEPYLEHDDPERYPRTKALMEALALGRHEPLFNLIEGGLKRKPDAFVILDPADLLFRIDSNSKQHVLWLYSKLKQLLAKYPHAVIILVFNLRKGDRRRKRPDLLINPREWLEEVSGSYDLINHSDVRLGMALRDEEVRVINGIRRGEPMNPVLLKEYALPQGSADEKLRLAGFDEVSADESVFLQSLPEKQIEYFVKLPDTFTFGEVVDKIVPRATLSRLLARGQSLGVIEKADNRYRKTVCLMGPAL